MLSSINFNLLLLLSVVGSKFSPPLKKMYLPRIVISVAIDENSVEGELWEFGSMNISI